MAAVHVGSVRKESEPVNLPVRPKIKVKMPVKSHGPSCSDDTRPFRDVLQAEWTDPRGVSRYFPRQRPGPGLNAAHDRKGKPGTAPCKQAFISLRGRSRATAGPVPSGGMCMVLKQQEKKTTPAGPGAVCGCG